MELNYFKDQLYNLLDDSTNLELADIDTDDAKNRLTITTNDGSMFDIEVKKLK